MGIEPGRHGLQFMADLVRRVLIEYTGLDGAFLAHLSPPLGWFFLGKSDCCHFLIIPDQRGFLMPFVGKL
jgi:hypothetical protein